MKKMHVQSRLLSLLLVLALLWGFAAPASAAGAAHRDGVSFTQVDNSAVSASCWSRRRKKSRNRATPVRTWCVFPLF